MGNTVQTNKQFECSLLRAHVLGLENDLRIASHDGMSTWCTIDLLQSQIDNTNNELDLLYNDVHITDYGQVVHINWEQ